MGIDDTYWSDEALEIMGDLPITAAFVEDVRASALELTDMGQVKAALAVVKPLITALGKLENEIMDRVTDGDTDSTDD